MGLFSKLFGSSNSEEQKDEKFKEFDGMYGGDEEMINLSKATWLTSRGNHSGKNGRFDDAIKDFEEAIKFKSDHLPAHLGLAIAWERKGRHEKALQIINDAPEEMKSLGKVVATKKDMMSQSM